MLIEFVCKWRMFDDVLLSMVATSPDGDTVSDHPIAGKGMRSVALIYGPNGSGKSSLINGLSMLQELVMGDVTVEYVGTAGTGRFEVVFEAEGRTYLYLLELSMGLVAVEELTEIRKDNVRIIFQRGEGRVRGVKANPDSDELLLRLLAEEGGVDGVHDVVRWFRRLDVIRDDMIEDTHPSPGVSRSIELAWRCLRAAKTGGVLVVDNLDLHLHPVMVSDLVDFMTHAASGQLIATTNAVHLLNNSQLDRDQIWFIDPKRDGTSELYSLVEFHEKDEALIGRDMMVNYLVGRCGGIPVQQDLHRIWEWARGRSIPD